MSGEPVTGAPSLWSAVADLPLRIDAYELEGLTEAVSSDFLRKSTVVHLRGDGEEGIGEDVTYDAVDQEHLQAAGPALPLAGSWTLGSFSEHVGGLDTFPVAPQRDVSRLYRRWAYESAALDLALRQRGVSLHEHLGRTPRPVTFVVSLRLGEPPTPGARCSAAWPGTRRLRFKLDATSSWDDDAGRRAGRQRSRRLDRPQGPLRRLDRRSGRRRRPLPARGRGVPPRLDRGSAAQRGDRRRPGGPTAQRFAWDAPIHSVADIEALPYPPGMVNIKPSRLGGLRSLLDAYDYCTARGIGMYGGGQFELGPGRGQNQYLASLWHPDGPNDVAPSGLQPAPAAGGPARQPAAGGRRADRLSLGVRRRIRRATLRPNRGLTRAEWVTSGARICRFVRIRRLFGSLVSPRAPAGPLTWRRSQREVPIVARSGSQTSSLVPGAPSRRSPLRCSSPPRSR